MSSLMRNYATFTAHSKPTVGDLKMSAVTEDHLGWLKCDGRELSISEWRFLFNAIGYQFGVGVAPNTFKLPNPAGTVAGTVGTGSGLTPRTLGASVGTETHVLTVTEMPDHSHTITDPTHSHGITDPGHTHTYSDTPNNQGVNTLTTQDDAADDFRITANTSLASTGITINSAATGITATNFTGGVGSSATSAADPDGPPVAAAAHNNMQPTLFMGSTFIYSGKPTFGTWPLTYNPPDLSTYGGQPQIL